jgi:transposase-like protein
MLTDAQPDLLAFAVFPRRHWRQIWSTNALERVNKEIKRRTDVVGVFPNVAALLRLARVGAHRAARRVGSRRTPLLFRSLHAGARHHEHHC